MVSCRGSVAKFVLCLVNLVFIVLALAVILLGSRMQMVKDSSNEVILEAFRWKTLSTFFIFVGFTLGIISVFGFGAAICESPMLLNIYVYFLALCSAACFGLYLALLFFTDQVISEVKTYYRKLMTSYNHNVDAMYIIQKVQAAFYCCGLYSAYDWNNSTFGNVSTDDQLYPASCCGQAITLSANETGKMCDKSELIYIDGCFSDVQLHRYKFVFRSLFVILFMVLLLLLSMACCLERDRHLQLAQIINLQYAAHLNSCRSQSATYLAGGQRPLEYQPMMAPAVDSVPYNGAKRIGKVGGGPYQLHGHHPPQGQQQAQMVGPGVVGAQASTSQAKHLRYI